jgi:hypothetical protein
MKSKTTSVVEYIAESAMLEVKADIESGKIPTDTDTECDQDMLIECLIKKLIKKRMTGKNLYGQPEVIIQSS